MDFSSGLFCGLFPCLMHRFEIHGHNATQSPTAHGWPPDHAYSYAMGGLGGIPLPSDPPSLSSAVMPVTASPTYHKALAADPELMWIKWDLPETLKFIKLAQYLRPYLSSMFHFADLHVAPLHLVKVTADDGGKRQREKPHHCRLIYDLEGGKSHVTSQKGKMLNEERQDD